MKGTNTWCLSMHHRHRHASKTRVLILVLVFLVSIFLIYFYVNPPRNNIACYVFSSTGCKVFSVWPPPSAKRGLTDEELASQVIIKEMLRAPLPPTKTPKIAFMFLTPGTLPFETLWDKFFSGHEGKFSVYIHASKTKPVHQTRYFVNTDIRSDKVVWGQVSMIDAERRLLGNALKDPDNHHFILLSDSCVPLHGFDYVYNYLMYSNLSYIDSFVDPGPHGIGRFSPRMLPEIEMKDFRKGAQWFSMKRQHALIVVSDNLYYSKFKKYCSPRFEGRSCYCDEHYIPTLFNMVDPRGMANWSVTHVDWSEHKWHPKSYKSRDVSYALLQKLTSIDETLHETSEAKKQADIRPCLWNGVKRPCYLFARKFNPETLRKLTRLFSNYTAA